MAKGYCVLTRGKVGCPVIYSVFWDLSARIFGSPFVAPRPEKSKAPRFNVGTKILPQKFPEIVLLEIFPGRNWDNLKEYLGFYFKLHFRHTTKIQVVRLIYSHDINVIRGKAWFYVINNFSYAFYVIFTHAVYGSQTGVCSNNIVKGVGSYEQADYFGIYLILYSICK